MLNEDLKKQIDASQSVLDAFDDKLNHLKQTVQNLNEKFNERNKFVNNDDKIALKNLSQLQS
jgi:predicted nuclease with TOPRIM domain